MKKLKSIHLKGDLLRLIASVYHNAPDILKLEDEIKNLTNKGNTQQAVILGLNLDEYLMEIDFPLKYLYFDPFIEEIHNEKLRELDYYNKLNYQFEYLYNKPKYAFDKEAEGVIFRGLDCYIFTSNLENYFNEVTQIFQNTKFFVETDFHRIKVFYTDYHNMKEIINSHDNFTHQIKS
ncbi:MAG: hypothetical protein AB8G11_06870 [Saprospiraceae bacterium]